MINFSYKKLKFSVILYTAVPIAVFFIGWLNPAAGTVFTLLLLAGVFFAYRKASDDDGIESRISVSGKTVAVLAVMAFVWCFLGGQGGFVSQTSDHIIRNAIISDMTLKDVPVTYDDGQNLLCYYVTYWTVPTTVGKLVYSLSGSEYAGLLTSNTVLLIFSTAGVFLTLLLTALVTSRDGRERPVLAAVMFILFSGLDIIGIILDGKLGVFDHFEWWAQNFQFSSNTTCLYWVYNQTIPIWLLTLCLINEKKPENFAFLGLLAFPYGPFPFVGIVIFCLIRFAVMLAESAKERTAGKTVLSALSPQNILGVIAVFPVYALYYTANVILMNNPNLADGSEAVYTGFRIHGMLTESLAGGAGTLLSFLGRYVLFIILEIGIYASVLINHYRKGERAEVIAVTVSLMIIPLFQIGYSYDFSMRVSIPGLVYLCVMFIRYMAEKLPVNRSGWAELPKKSREMLAVICIVFALGSFTALQEISREIINTALNFAGASGYVDNEAEGFDYDNITTIDDESENGNFFAVNYRESPFGKYLSRK